MRERTVLVVDDERFIVDLLTELLEEEGFRVQRAYDGAAALEILDHARPDHLPDLIVADVMMPKLDGLSLLTKIRERNYPIPIVLMSAAVTPRNAGVAFVAKPFDVDHILNVIEHLMDYDE